MRQALASKGSGKTRRQISSVRTFPAPVGGWNARDSLAAMAPTDAVLLKNWFPRTTDCVIRGGYQPHIEGADGNIMTLAVYNALNGTSKMFAASNAGVWDASSPANISGNYAVLPGASGDYLSTPDAAALDITGDIDIRGVVAPTSFTSVLAKTIVSKYNETGNQRSFLLNISTDGRLQLIWSANGSFLHFATSVASFQSIGAVEGFPIGVRATLDVNDGAGNNVTTFYYSLDFGATWIQFGDAITEAGTTSIFSSTASLEVGTWQAGTREIFTGDIYLVEVRNGIDGTLVASMDPDDANPGDGAFVSSATGETWTVNGNAEIATSAEDATSTNGAWQYVNFGDGTNNYLIMVNGEDKPLYYNGTAWIEVDAASSPAITGVTSSSLIHVMVYQGRLFFIQKNTLSFWYLTAGAAGGAATEFDLSSIARMGGYLVAMTTWTFDGGDGPDDYAVFVTSEGEVIVYRGTNPSSANTWLKVGTYFIGKPLSRRCFVNYGGDVVLITQNGAFPLSQALQSATVDYKTALTNKIENAFNEAYRAYGSNFGWEGTLFPAQSAIVFNVPTSELTQAKQFVMNTITKSWCEFDSWNATTFAVFDNELYFAVGTAAYKAWTGTADGDDEIIAPAKTAFSNFGSGSQEKRFTLFRPLFYTNGPIAFLTGLDIDFKDTEITGEATYSVTGGAQWDVSNWDESYWAAGMDIAKVWTSPQDNIGYWAAGKIKITTDSLTISWVTNDFVFEAGGIL